MLRIPGHTILLATKESGRVCEITLECTCGRIFARGLFAVDDALHRGTVCDDGHKGALQHLWGTRSAEGGAEGNAS